MTMEYVKPENDYLMYNISVSSGEANRKRKIRDEYEMKVSVFWNVTQVSYSREDLSQPLLTQQFEPYPFRDIEYRLFTVIEEGNISIVDLMLTNYDIIGVVHPGDPEIKEMVSEIRRVIDEAQRSGKWKESAVVTVNVRTRRGLPREDYQQVLRTVEEQEAQETR